MKLKIKYLGLLSEVANCTEEQVEVSMQNVFEVLDFLYLKYPALKNKEFQVALNNKIVPKQTEINEGELALLPPFSGG